MLKLSLRVESANVPGVVVLSGAAGGGEFSTESLLLPVLFSPLPQLMAKIVAASIPAARIRFIGKNFSVCNLLLFYYSITLPPIERGKKSFAFPP